MAVPSGDTGSNLIRMPPETCKPDIRAGSGGAGSLIPRNLASQKNSKNASGWKNSDFFK